MRIPIFNIKVSKTNLSEAEEFLTSYDYSQSHYICLPDLSVIIAAQKNKFLKEILENSLQTFPDGKPLEFYAKIKGHKNISTISGYWLIKRLLKTSLRHYFYGGNAKCLEALQNKLENDFPDANILAYSSPPFVELNEIANNSEIAKDLDEINQLKPDIIWLGISSPKQDYLMHEFHNKLNHGVMIGVGGVFDYLAETKKISPEWVKKIGLRWFFRFIQEPRRLFKRYFVTALGLFRLIMISAGLKIKRSILGRNKRK